MKNNHHIQHKINWNLFSCYDLGHKILFQLHAKFADIIPDMLIYIPAWN